MTFCRLKEKSITSRVEGLNLFKDLIENYGLGGSSSVTLRSYSKEGEGEASIYVIFGWGIRTVTHTHTYVQSSFHLGKKITASHTEHTSQGNDFRAFRKTLPMHRIIIIK